MSLSPIIETMARWVIQASWQAAGLAVVIAVIQAVLGRRLDPRFRYALWGIVIARLLMPVTLPSRLSVWNLVKERPVVAQATAPDWERRLQVRAGIAATSGKASPQVAPVQGRAPTPSPWLAAGWVWLAVAVLLGARLLAASAVVRSRIRAMPAISCPDVIELVNRCARELGIRCPPRLLQVPAGTFPALVGLWRPALLVPADLVCADVAALKLVILHELAHQRRHDVAANWLLSVLAAVHWFNPVLWWAFARIRIERELACDAAVIDGHARDALGRRAYAQLMLKLVVEACARPGLPAGAAVGICEDARQIKRRLAMIVHPRRASRPWSLIAAGLALAAAVVTCTQATRGQEKRGSGASNIAAAQTQPSRIDAVIEAAAASSASAAPDLSNPALALSAGAILTKDELADQQLNARTADQLRRPLPEFSYGATALSIVLDTFGKDAGVDVNVDWWALKAAGVDKNTTIDLRSHGAPAARVLEMILNNAGGGSVRLDYRITAGVVHVSTGEVIDRTSTTVVYDVQELMGDLKDKALDTKMKSLVHLIMDSISPESWRDNGGSVGSILTFDSKLIVSQSGRAQDEISVLLGKLKTRREQRSQARPEPRP